MALSRYSICFAIVVRKTFTLFLLLIILVQVIGYYFAFRLRQVEVRREVYSYLKSHTSDKNLTHFQLRLINGQFTDERFSWENENEFEFAGKMYDVIERTVTGNNVVLHCLEDKKETELVKAFEETQRSQTQQSKNRTASLLQILSIMYLPVQVESVSPDSISAQHIFISYSSSVIERATDILTPPPQDC